MADQKMGLRELKATLQATRRSSERSADASKQVLAKVDAGIEALQGYVAKADSTKKVHLRPILQQARQVRTSVRASTKRTAQMYNLTIRQLEKDVKELQRQRTRRPQRRPRSR